MYVLLINFMLKFCNMMVLLMLVLVGIFMIWFLLKPKKTERKRFSLRERRLQREAEKDDKEN